MKKENSEKKMEFVFGSTIHVDPLNKSH